MKGYGMFLTHKNKNTDVSDLCICEEFLLIINHGRFLKSRYLKPGAVPVLSVILQEQFQSPGSFFSWLLSASSSASSWTLL